MEEKIALPFAASDPNLAVKNGSEDDGLDVVGAIQLVEIA
jgi:hypothetical protein